MSKLLKMSFTRSLKCINKILFVHHFDRLLQYYYKSYVKNACINNIKFALTESVYPYEIALVERMNFTKRIEVEIGIKQKN